MKTCAVCHNTFAENLRYCPNDGAGLVASADRAFPIGETVDGYTVVDRLDGGGFGETFLVEHSAIGRRAVMKVLFESDEVVFERLKSEFRFLSSLDEPAFARVFGFGTAWQNRPYLVMEFVQGQTLTAILKRRGRLELVDALAVALRLAHGLGRLHDAGIIHRDIKPGNIVIPDAAGTPSFDQAKLIDFGVFGQLVQAGSSRMTRAGVFVGTPRYMSPEQIRGLSQSPGTDVYGLALLLVEMLYGDLPFESSETSAIALMARIAQTDLVLPSRPEVPEQLRALLSRSLSRDPTLRPADASAFADELLAARRAFEQRVSAAFPSTLPSPPPQRPGSPSPPTASPLTRRRSSKSSKVKELEAPRSMNRPTVWLFRALLVVPLLAALIMAQTSAAVFSGAGLVAVIWIAVGISLAAGGILLGNVVRRVARSRLHEVEIDAERLLLGLGTKRSLSETIQVEIAQIITRCRALDERLLGVTILKMIDEYDAAKESDQRQAALMNVATLLEKLRGRLSPWYARFEKQLAIATSVIGVASGILTVVAGIVKIAKGQP